MLTWILAIVGHILVGGGFRLHKIARWACKKTHFLAPQPLTRAPFMVTHEYSLKNQVVLHVLAN